jgi:hypothetical protein
MAHMGNTMMGQSLRAPQRAFACLSARVKSDLEILLLMCP